MSHPVEPLQFTAELGERGLFPDLQARAYLAHAAVSPPSSAVRVAVDEFITDYARRGVGAFGRWGEQREHLRRQLAELVGASPGDIGLVPNTTQGAIHIALGIPWRRGDRVVLFEGEFPANVTPWQQAARLFDLEIVFLPLREIEKPGGADLGRLETELQRGVRLVAASAVQFQTGLRMPMRAMAQLCHAHGAELFVDGIQACGGIPVDVRADGIDYLACGGHKWLMGLEGAGFLYVHPGCAAALRPHTAGWLSHEDALAFLTEGAGHLRYDRPFKARADVFEIGTASVIGYAALQASTQLLVQLGPEEVMKHVTRYLDPLETALEARGFVSLRAPDAERRSSILSFRPPAGISAVDLVHALGTRGVVASAPDGLLRFAPHWPNALAEVDGVIDAVDDARRAL